MTDEHAFEVYSFGGFGFDILPDGSFRHWTIRPDGRASMVTHRPLPWWLPYFVANLWLRARGCRHRYG